MRSRWARLFLCAALAACGGTDIPSDLPHQQTIPAAASNNIFRIDPTQISYDYVDTTAGNNTHLLWLADRPFTGYNCIAFAPRSATEDTIGTFVFMARGTNTGFVERHDQTTVDTATAYLLIGSEGSRGTYKIDASNQLHLFWNNGDQNRYFDPSALLRFGTGGLSSDNLTSNVTLQFAADSITARWGIFWVRVSAGVC